MAVSGPFTVGPGAKAISKEQEFREIWFESVSGPAGHPLLVTVKSPAFWGAILVMATGAGLLFVSEMELNPCRELNVTEAPVATVPKSMGFGEALKPPTTTVPARVVEALPFTLLPRSAVTKALAVYVPTVAGAVKVTTTTQELPAAIVAPIVPGAQVDCVGTIAKSEELPPVRYKLEIVTGPVPEFVSVTLCGADVGALFASVNVAGVPKDNTPWFTPMPLMGTVIGVCTVPTVYVKAKLLVL